MALWRLLLIGLISRLVASFHADASTNPCPCGYSINDPSSEQYAVFTEALETDFSRITNIADNACWLPQTYSVTAEQNRGPYGKMATPLNVKPNPVKGTHSGQIGVNSSGGPAGLQLWVNSRSVDNMVPMAEIATKDNNMLYGTFRIRMRVTNVPGTCTGFFWVNDFASFLDALADTSWMQYQSNVEEIDMELLSSSYNNTSKPIYLVMQTPMAAKDGYNVAGTSTFRIQQLPFEPSDSFHEYRFDWTNDRVVFYADGNRISSMTWTYPEEPGQLAVNHWSNGNALWSKGPPNEAAVTTIEWVKAYYNSSNTDKDAEHAIRCPGLESSQICVVPDFSSSHPVDVFYQNRTMCGESDVDGGSPSKVEKTADAASSKTSMTTTQRTMPLSRALASIEWWLLLAMVTAFIATMY